MSASLVAPAAPLTASERETELLARVPSGLYIDGVWERGSGEPTTVTDPATGLPLKQIANADAVDGLCALDAAVDAALGQRAAATARPAVRPENRQPPRNVPSSER